MPTTAFLICWKKNRNHRGREIAFSPKKAMDIMDQKKCLGFKVWSNKLAPDDPIVVHYQRYGIVLQP